VGSAEFNLTQSAIEQGIVFAVKHVLNAPSLDYSAAVKELEQGPDILPMKTKFMIALLLSPNFELYETFFAQFDETDPLTHLLARQKAQDNYPMTKCDAIIYSYYFAVVEAPDLYKRMVGDEKKAPKDVIAKLKYFLDCGVKYGLVDVDGVYADPY